MTAQWLRFLGIDVGPNARVAGVEFLLRAGAGASGAAWLLLLLLALAVGAVILYRREITDAPAWRRYLMAAFRVGFLALLLALFIRPALRVTLEGDVRRQLVLLLDASQSMSLRDQRSDPPDLKRAAIASDLLDPNRGLDQEIPIASLGGVSDAPREQLVRQLLTSPRLNLLTQLQKNYDLKLLTFGKDTAELVAASTPDAPTTAPASDAGEAPADPRLPLRAIDNLKAAAPATALGDAVREVISRSRGQPVAGVFVVTDGASNTGLSPISAAQSAGQNGLPLYIWGVGLTRPRDLAVSQVFAPETGFIDDEVAVSVRLRFTGLEGKQATVNLKLGDQIVATEKLDIGPDGEATVQTKFTPKTAGDYQLTADVPVLPGEVVKDNNTQSVKLRVVDGKIKVLYVESQPRWEYKYLQALLLRDRRVEPKFLLLDSPPGKEEAGAGGGGGGGGGGPYIARFPTSREELFKYDLVILGDVDPQQFTSEQLKWMEEHVSKFGAGLVALAGHQFMPHAWSNTPLEKLLPVEWEAPGVGGAIASPRSDASSGTEPIRLALTPSGRASTMLRLAETEAESASQWARLPPIYWTARVTRPRAAADVLVVDEDANKASRFGKMPVIALQQFGVGSSLYIGTDNLWRWRRNTGDRFHAQLWGQIVQRLALPHLLGESKRTFLTADRRSYSAGQTATLYARLYSPTFEPITLPSVRGTLTQTPGGARAAVVLRAVPDQSGMYRGEAVIPQAGTWLFSVETDDKTSLELQATESKIELTESAMNEALLREMARLSAGAFLREEDIHTLPDLLARRSERVRSTVETELWSSPLYFTLMIALLAGEWALRKGAMLK